MGKVDVESVVESRGVEWLQAQVPIYKLPDIHKAVRCLIQYTIQETDTTVVFGQEAQQAAQQAGEPKCSQKFTIEKDQQTWLEDMCQKYSLAGEVSVEVSAGLALGSVLYHGVRHADPASVFGVVRKTCTHGPNCATCGPKTTFTVPDRPASTTRAAPPGAPSDVAHEGKVRVGILTVSDTVARGGGGDRSGPAAEAAVMGYDAEFGGVVVTHRAVVADETAEIQEVLKQWSDVEDLHLIITSGGTGFAPRDVTPEATLPLLHKQTPGLVQVMMMKSLQVTPTAMLSRPAAGIRGATLILNMPGNPKAVGECLEALMPGLPHGIRQMRGDKDASHPRHTPHAPPPPSTCVGACGK